MIHTATAHLAHASILPRRLANSVTDRDPRRDPNSVMPPAESALAPQISPPLRDAWGIRTGGTLVEITDNLGHPLEEAEPPLKFGGVDTATAVRQITLLVSDIRRHQPPDPA